MITRAQLRELHGGDLPLHILEQDYVQSLFLMELYGRDDHIVFKGGTFIKHAYGLDRFSEDLDFTLRDEFDIVKVIDQAAKRLDRYGITAEVEDLTRGRPSINARLRYRGPLYNGTPRSIGTIRIEVSRRDDIILAPVWTRLFFKYPETAVVNVLSLRKEEVLAEKVRALSTRSKGRDLYDVWFLLNQGAVPDRELFVRKMQVVEKEPVVSIGISEEDWKYDLKNILVRPPDLSMVLDRVRGELTARGFDVISDP